MLDTKVGQDKKDVRALFDVTKIAPAKDDPAGTVHLQLKPKDGSDFARKFSTIDVWIDPATQMPLRIETLDKNQTTDRQTDLQNLKANAGIVDGDFSLPSIDDNGWNRHDESFSN